MSAIDDMLKIARDVQPDLWSRTEAVAKIIAPEAFAADWVIHPPERAAVFTAKLKLMQANAMSKAQAVLAYLGVNTETDWLTILERMASQADAAPAARED